MGDAVFDCQDLGGDMEGIIWITHLQNVGMAVRLSNFG